MCKESTSACEATACATHQEAKGVGRDKRGEERRVGRGTKLLARHECLVEPGRQPRGDCLHTIDKPPRVSPLGRRHNPAHEDAIEGRQHGRHKRAERAYQYVLLTLGRTPLL
eukprot:scaffold281525_cov32-Tisochrysis_lutea.AAC.7